MYLVFGGSDPWVEYHFRVYHVLGDPSLHVWKDVPQNVNVIHPDTVVSGFSQLPVSVTYTSSGLSVANAEICISGNGVFALGTTDVNGFAMIDINPWIRLVKGAYNEPDTVAFKKKKDADENYFTISKYLLEQMQSRDIRIAFATHDLNLHEQIKNEARKYELPNEKIEFQMLYGIKEREQISLASQGYDVRTLISYGKLWYPWYMRRLAERPANVGFVLKNIFSN